MTGMVAELQRGFGLVERQRSALQSAALALSGAQLDWAPDGATWGVRRIVEHLVLSDETLGRAHAVGAVPAEAAVFRVLPRAWRRALVLGAFGRDTALPLPSPAVEPCGEVPLPDLLSRWDRARQEMCRALETLRGDEARYSHPVLGPLTATQMLELEEAHTAYHARQMDKLRADAAFPHRAAP